MPRLFEELVIAHGDGRYVKFIAQLAKVDVLLLDDWGLAVLTDSARRDLLEILDDRHGQRSTIVTSQLPLAHWHDAIGDPTRDKVKSGVWPVCSMMRQAASFC